MEGINIHNEVNRTDIHIGFSFTRKDQLYSDVIWSVFDKVSQYNSRFNSSDTQIVTVYTVTMPVGYCGDGIKRKGRPIATMVQVKRSIVEAGAEENIIALALIIAIDRLNNDPNYKAYR